MTVLLLPLPKTFLVGRVSGSQSYRLPSTNPEARPPAQPDLCTERKQSTSAHPSFENRKPRVRNLFSALLFSALKNWNPAILPIPIPIHGRTWVFVRRWRKKGEWPSGSRTVKAVGWGSPHSASPQNRRNPQATS